ncbi:hypothetical protein [Halobacillus litoralis]|nr:hypothetical protein [Halobacillus litoralis]
MNKNSEVFSEVVDRVMERSDRNDFYVGFLGMLTGFMRSMER